MKTTLFRELVEGPPHVMFHDLMGLVGDLSDSLQSAIPIHIGNVATYYFEDSGKDIYDLKSDFPNVAPPFKSFIMEFELPKFINIENRLMPMEEKGISAYFFHSIKIQGGWWLYFFPYIKPLKTKSNNHEIENRIFSPGIAGRIRVSGDGKILELADGNYVQFMYIKDQRDIDTKIKFIQSGLFPCLLAISFTHCKNVELIQQGNPTPGRRNRRAPGIKFYTLDILPMRQVLKHEGQSEKTGLRNALHICRGHFKDYTQNGLFGRYKGVYWWDEQARGALDRGAVLKEYNVKNKNKGGP